MLQGIRRSRVGLTELRAFPEVRYAHDLPSLTERFPVLSRSPWPNDANGLKYASCDSAECANQLRVEQGQLGQLQDQLDRLDRKLESALRQPAESPQVSAQR